MPKEIPEFPEDGRGRRPGVESLEYSIELLTPMFGGGAEAKVPDPVTPFRPSEIRGQLRFWWRATRGASCASPGELFERQSVIWGSTRRASPVRVEVAEGRAGRPTPCARYAWESTRPGKPPGWHLRWNPPLDRRRALPYALFPFQGIGPEKTRPDAAAVEPPSSCIASGSFRLIVTLSRPRDPSVDLKREVGAAVWAWVNFGGLGARTRRGCGALRSRDPILGPRGPEAVADWFDDARDEFGLAPPPTTRAWPTLPGSLLVKPAPGPSLDAWDGLIALFKDFRQPGRSGGPPFPEADAIRDVYEQRRAGRRESARPESASGVFPRAEFGLPILFHFKESRRRVEPPDSTLVPRRGGDRMASPLILRPLGLAGDRAVPMIVRLDAPGPGVDGLDLLDPDGRPLGGPWERSAIEMPAFRDHSAIEEFLQTARRQGYR